MNRRKFVIGVTGSMSIAGGIVGSGAFSAAEANRNITVNVESDENAYLELDDISSNFSKMSDGELNFVFNEEVDQPGGVGEDVTGDGVSRESVYEFSSVVNVKNSGTNDIVIFGEYDDDALEAIQLTQSTPPRSEPLTEGNPSQIVSPGSSINLGIVIETGDVDPQTIETQVSIVGASEGSELYPDAFPETQ